MSEFEEMPPESAYRGAEAYSAEEMEGLELLFAMRNPNNVRWKLKVLGREARDPAKGRTLTANCWVRLDGDGNPEIIDEAKGSYDSHKFVCARFCVDGIRVAIGGTSSFSRSGGVSTLYEGLTDYNIDSRNHRGATAVLKDFEFDDDVIQGHPTLWGWADHNHDNCPICVKYGDLLTNLQKDLEANDEAIEQNYTDNTIFPVEAPDNYDFRDTLFVPWTKHSERLAGSEGQQVGWWRKYDDMMLVIDKHFQKIRTKRGKPKDVF